MAAIWRFERWGEQWRNNTKQTSFSDIFTALLRDAWVVESGKRIGGQSMTVFLGWEIKLCPKWIGFDQGLIRDSYQALNHPSRLFWLQSTEAWSASNIFTWINRFSLIFDQIQRTRPVVLRGMCAIPPSGHLSFSWPLGFTTTDLTNTGEEADMMSKFGHDFSCSLNMCGWSSYSEIHSTPALNTNEHQESVRTWGFEVMFSAKMGTTLVLVWC